MRLLPVISSGLAWMTLASAQVTVEVVLEQEQFLPSESIVVGVRITNFSGQTLELGGEEDWLRFNIEARGGYPVAKLGEPPAIEPFRVESSKVATRRVDVAPCFALTRPGHYLLTATVHLSQWGRDLTSRPKEFDVINGTTLWEQDFGVPRRGDDKGTPEVRRYALQQAIHLKEMKLYARVTDQTQSRVFRVFPIGPMVSFSNPERQIDKESQLHVLYQTGARAFNYSVINPDGQLLVRRTYEYGDTRPVLRMDRDGKIVVFGGVRRITRDDLPASGGTATPGNDAPSTRP